MRNVLRLLSVLAAVAVCSRASAMCCGGGMSGGMGGGVARGGGVTWTGSNGGYRAARSEDKVTSKADLPAAATLTALNTKAWDNAYTQLSLTTEQMQKVDALLAELKSTADKLAKEQSESRSAYDKAVTQSVIMESARRVIDAADAIHNFNPNTKFDLGIAAILNSQQKAKYHDLKMKS